MRRVLVSATLLLGLTGPVTSSASAVNPPQSNFIVVLRSGSDDVQGTAAELAMSMGGEVGFVYETAVEGFSMTATAAEAAALSRDPSVAYVERDRPVTLDAQSIPTGIARSFASANPSIDIDSIDDVRVDVDVAVLDTGVDLQHPDLNVAGGVNCTTVSGCQPGGDDDSYHGTHVAGIIGALDNNIGVVGVAPGARIWSVKVLDQSGSGFVSWIVQGLDWVAANAQTIDVANMSISAAGFSQALHDATQAAVDHGVAFAAAAGNLDANASGYSPASFSNVLTVSALADFDGAAGGIASPTCAADQDDTLADFSNWGAVDVAAPGVCIVSTVPLEWGSYGLLSGTSMASPYVAGALALLARRNNPSNAADVQALYDQVIASGNFSWTDESGDGVKEPLLDFSNAAVFSATTPCAAIDTSGLLGWWRGEDTLGAEVGPGLSGSPEYGAAEVGRGMVLSETNVVSVGAFPPVSTAVTVEAWVKPAANTMVQTVMSRWDFPSTDDSARVFSLMLFPNGDIVWDTDEVTLRRPAELRASVPQIYDGSFHHVAATWNGSVIAVYFDGALVGSKPSQGGTLNPAPATVFRLGSQSGRGDPFHFVGTLDEPSVWGRALTAAEITAIHTAGANGKCPTGTG